MRDNYRKNIRIPQGATTESRRAGHERMAGKHFWRSDWFLGLSVAIAVFLLSATDLVGSLERKAYDLGVRASTREPSGDIAVIAIDDTSIANIGRWPWPRDVHAQLIDRLAQAKVIGYTVFFSEPQIDPALPYINQLNELYGLLSPAGQEQLAEFEVGGGEPRLQLDDLPKLLHRADRTMRWALRIRQG